MMNFRCRSFIVLLYLCLAIFSMLLTITISFSLLGYWIGGGENILSFFIGKLFTYFKVSLSGILMGFVLCFFTIGIFKLKLR